jgi:predicted Zn-dependent peptidase
LFSIYAATARRQSSAAAQLIEEIVTDAVDTITPREVERVRTQAKAGLLMSMESPWGQAHYVARQLSIHGGWSSLRKWSPSLATVTLDRPPRRGEDARRPAPAPPSAFRRRAA